MFGYYGNVKSQVVYMLALHLCAYAASKPMTKLADWPWSSTGQQAALLGRAAPHLHPRWHAPLTHSPGLLECTGMLLSQGI